MLRGQFSDISDLSQLHLRRRSASCEVWWIRETHWGSNGGPGSTNHLLNLTAHIWYRGNAATGRLDDCASRVTRRRESPLLENNKLFVSPFQTVASASNGPKAG
jgi:hypothetical protein